jgi:hypothetical protein
MFKLLKGLGVASTLIVGAIALAPFLADGLRDSFASPAGATTINGHPTMSGTMNAMASMGQMMGGCNAMMRSGGLPPNSQYR